MAHLMAGGQPCGLADGHLDHCRSVASVEQRRRYFRRYNATAAGILRDIRAEAKRRGNRSR